MVTVPIPKLYIPLDLVQAACAPDGLHVHQAMAKVKHATRETLAREPFVITHKDPRTGLRTAYAWPKDLKLDIGSNGQGGDMLGVETVCHLFQSGALRLQPIIKNNEGREIYPIGVQKLLTLMQVAPSKLAFDKKFFTADHSVVKPVERDALILGPNSMLGGIAVKGDLPPGLERLLIDTTKGQKKN